MPGREAKGCVLEVTPSGPQDEHSVLLDRDVATLPGEITVAKRVGRTETTPIPETNQGFLHGMLLAGETVMLSVLLGPFLALLPERWRRSLPGFQSFDWRVPFILSGFGELLAAVVAMVYWYSYSVSSWVSRGLDVALAGKAGPGVNEQEIGFMAIFLFSTHPLTWLIAYFAVEGSVRLVGAAFAESHLGSLPLFVLDKISLKITGQGGPSAAREGGYREGNWSSYVGAIREKVLVSRRSSVPDELSVLKEGAEEFLEIRASRRKPDWTPPRTVKYQHTFYRLEGCSNGPGARPFRYRLRRLSAGVMSRTVLVYLPEQEPVVSRE